MKSLDEIYEYINSDNNLAMILIISNNKSKSLLNYLFNTIYKKCTLQKIEYDKCKGLIKRVEKHLKKIIKINLELTKIRFSSSNNPAKLYTDFVLLKSIVFDNMSKILFKTNLTSYKNYVDLKNLRESIIAYDIFDLIIFIDKDDIKVLKSRKRNLDGVFLMEQLLRKVKLKQIQDRLKKYEKI
jgi:hypothetical protein